MVTDHDDASVMFKRLICWFSKRDIIKIQLCKASALAIFFNVLFGLLFYIFEISHQKDLTLLDSLWWSMVTMTTVGYGDFYAQSFIGRFIISYACMLVGIGIISYFVGILAESMLERISKRKKGLMHIRYEDHIIICHFPGIDKVLQVVEELRANAEYESKKIVLVSDVLDEIPDEIAAANLQFVKGNPAREDILMKANVTVCEGVFVLAQDPGNPDTDTKTFAVGAIVEMIEREIGRPIKVVVELVSKHNLKMMRRAQTDGIVMHEGITDCLLVQEYLYPGIHDIFQQIIRNTVGSQFYIFETRLNGYTIRDILQHALEYPSNLQIIGILNKGKHILNPPKNMCIEENDKLIVLAENRSDFQNLQNQMLASD